MILGLAGQGFAQTPQFTINPDALPGGSFGNLFTADALSVANSSELITLSAIAGSPAGTKYSPALLGSGLTTASISHSILPLH
jgi:hypothetical protein